MTKEQYEKQFREWGKCLWPLIWAGRRVRFLKAVNFYRTVMKTDMPKHKFFRVGGAMVKYLKELERECKYFWNDQTAIGKLIWGVFVFYLFLLCFVGVAQMVKILFEV